MEARNLWTAITVALLGVAGLTGYYTYRIGSEACVGEALRAGLLAVGTLVALALSGYGLWQTRR